MPGSTETETVTSTETDEGVLGRRQGQSAALRWVHRSTGLLTLLSDAPVTIGRDSDCTARLDSAQVSRRHAEITFVSGVHAVSDCSSKNGVFLNGERIERAVLESGDVLRVGDWLAVVEVVGPDELGGFGQIGAGVFGGAALRRVVQRCKQVATGNLNVVLQGETGTGKEFLARLIHEHSRRAGVFLAVNCAGYSAGTAAAELFGHRKGAFTGAERASVGHVRAAHLGTLFLDEILELPLELQANLLRVLEQHEVLPLGESEATPVDVLFVAATQKSLSEAALAGRFRTDLRARLEGMVIELPPLRERRSDIVPLFSVLLARHGSNSPPKLEVKLAERLSLYDWPMNVRELENVVRRLRAVHPAEAELTLEHLEGILTPDAAGSESALPRVSDLVPSRGAPYPVAEIQALLGAIERHAGNLTKAASELGIERTKAYRMLHAAKSKR
jgi:transcriptional regulator with AAA-type ATPase domain